MHCLIYPTYFPNITSFIAMLHANTVTLEICDNYQKQTYRSRTDIYAANGKLTLTIPVKYSQKNRQLYKDVKIANKENWQLQHQKSLQSAYSMSPFFDYYIDELMPIFNTKFQFLLDLNFKCLDILQQCLQIKLKIKTTTIFEKQTKDKSDYRVFAKKNNNIQYSAYTQVFSKKHGFISNLSILDLLFNEGPNTQLYLEKQKINHTKI